MSVLLAVVVLVSVLPQEGEREREREREREKEKGMEQVQKEKGKGKEYKKEGFVGRMDILVQEEVLVLGELLVLGPLVVEEEGQEHLHVLVEELMKLVREDYILLLVLMKMVREDHKRLVGLERKGVVVVVVFGDRSVGEGGNLLELAGFLELEQKGLGIQRQNLLWENKLVDPLEAVVVEMTFSLSLSLSLFSGCWAKSEKKPKILQRNFKCKIQLF